MATPSVPLPEPFSEALAEAAESAAMAMRLLLTVTDAVRRAAQKHRTGKEEELGDDAAKLAPGWAEAQLRPVLDASVLGDLVSGADWPQMARQLVSLQQAGVDMTAFLPQLGGVASTVQRAVEANSARIKAAGTDRWADQLRATMPEGMVRDAILASPAWPDMAAAMDRLHGQGVDVPRLLTDAHKAGVGVDQAVAAVLAAAPPAPAPAPPTPAPARAAAPRPRRPRPGPQPAHRDRAKSRPRAPPRPAIRGRRRPPPRRPRPRARSRTRSAARPAPAAGTAPAPAPAREPVVVSEDARRYWGPLTEGLPLPANLDLDLGVRDKALEQLGVRPAVHARIVATVNDVLGERDAGLLVGARPWPLLAARMQQLGESDGPKAVAEHLSRLNADDSWRQGPPGEFARRMVMTTHQALTTPPGEPLTAATRVSAAAARSRSTTTPAAAPARRARPRPSKPCPRTARRPRPYGSRVAAGSRSRIWEWCRPG
ncbi:hypothetical protein M8Z33_41835 [Streptomyces sp. ZAF1911]|uniref:hypothetical protein n=1 Tax=Streptomyces sp. ZAF1911 TaxID=2944129 RepID=UPI00237AF0CA|nr:hypothetical protein [Streptomyces sp. ZAF1911]MDD9383079.1 hypothetical protein [Streptomyces sp. ZAF1911]